MSYINMKDLPKFLEIVDKYNLPTPLEVIKHIEGKTVDYVIDDHDIQIITFTDNTFCFLWSSEGIKTEESFEDIYIEQGSYLLTLLKDKYPEGIKEWDDYKQELKKKDDEAKREYRYQEYLKLKKEFEV